MDNQTTIDIRDVATFEYTRAALAQPEWAETVRRVDRLMKYKALMLDSIIWKIRPMSFWNSDSAQKDLNKEIDDACEKEFPGQGWWKR